MIFKFGGQLQPVEIEEWEAERSPAVFVTDAQQLAISVMSALSR